MTSVESAVPAKTQEPNEYWEHVKSKDRVYFIGRTPEGEMVWQCEGDCIEVGNLDWSGWQHLPDCTGWEWEPVPAEPQKSAVLFVPVAPEMDWVVQDRVPARNNVDEWCWCERGSSPGHFYSGFGGWSGDIRHGHIIGNEVLHLRCRRKDLPPVPAPVEETFPQWYILKESEIRSWCPPWAIERRSDEICIRYARDEAGNLSSETQEWYGGTDAWQRCSAAEAMGRLGVSMLPYVPAEPRRVPVKLWVTYRLNDEGGDWPVRATQADQTCQNWKEIKFDGNGAFIEVEQ